MNNEQNNYDENTEELLKNQNKQLRLSRTVLVLLVIAIILLVFLLFKKCNCTCNCCKEGSTSEIVSGNSIRLVETQKDPQGHGDDNPSRHGTDDNPDQPNPPDTPDEPDDGPGGGDTPEPPEDETEDIKLSDRDHTHTENQPFDVLFAPGDSETKKYAVEVSHKQSAKLYFGLDNLSVYDAAGNVQNLSNVLAADDTVLDIIHLNIKVGGIEKYSGTFKNFVDNNIEYQLSSSNSTDTVEYTATISIPTDVEDDFSDNSDGNYQNMLVKFALKWWVQ